MLAVVFLYKITIFLQQNITASLLELYFNDSMQTVRARRRRRWQSTKRGRRWGRWADVVFTDTAPVYLSFFLRDMVKIQQVEDS